jgi:glucosylglycerate phosphorylase
MDTKDILKELYPLDHGSVNDSIERLIETMKTDIVKPWVDERDVMLITYGDSIIGGSEAPLRTLRRFLDARTDGLVTNVHLLPMFPFSSDDGFSVIDYDTVDPRLGTWKDVSDLARDRGLMFDAVVNHISSSSAWFRGYLDGDPAYDNHFITCDPSLDYSDIVRPRALPLYYPYQAHDGTRHIWATFSDDQVDLNYENPDVLLRILKVLGTYALKGARFIRLDAVGFMWKKIGTPSIHLRETHLLVKLMRSVVDRISPGTILITETNVPHDENVSYFGQGDDEAHMVYQFPLPPLVLHALLTGKTHHLSKWAERLDRTPLKGKTAFFNFLASHDGIGMRPVEDILPKEDRQMLADHVIANGGRISYKNNKDGTTTPYELNISYLDAVSDADDPVDVKTMKMMAAQTILLSFKGVPGIYIHSLLGSQNDIEGLMASSINRRINREKLDLQTLERELDDPGTLRHNVFNAFMKLLGIRRSVRAFSPDASQRILFPDDRVFAAERYDEVSRTRVLVLVNVTDSTFTLDFMTDGTDLIASESVTGAVTMGPYQARWIVNGPRENDR